jgi:hypothetical protein
LFGAGEAGVFLGDFVTNHLHLQGELADSKLLSLAADRGHTKVVQQLIAAGAVVDAGVMQAAIRWPEMLRSLLAMSGAARDAAPSVLSRTTFDFQWESAALLLAAGASPTLEAFHNATLVMDYGAACLLIACGLVVDPIEPALRSLGNCTEPMDGSSVDMGTEKDRWRKIADDKPAVEKARRAVDRAALQLLSTTTLDACIALQDLGLDALCMSHILTELTPFDPPVHVVWVLATKVKHFKD